MQNWAKGNAVDCVYHVIPERLQECLRFLEVSRVKALGEPAIDRRQQLAGVGLLALPLPEGGSG